MRNTIQAVNTLLRTHTYITNEIIYPKINMTKIALCVLSSYSRI